MTRSMLSTILPRLGPNRRSLVYATEQSVAQSRLRLALSEYELLKHRDPDKVPQHLSPSQLDYLLSLHKTRPSKRMTWLDVSYQLREGALQRMRQLEAFVGTGSILLPFIGAEAEKLLRRQQTSLMPHLPNIIFDISFDDYMSSLECKNLAEQLIRIFLLNKFGIESSHNHTNLNLFNLHVTNLEASKLTNGFLSGLFDNSARKYFPNVIFHEQSFTELFPDKKLIYLSPHASETMAEYDHEAYYIIGGIVDRREIVELTPAKCSQLGIRSVRLPLESALVRKEVQSLCDVFKLLYEFKYHAAFEQSSISALVRKHLSSNKKGRSS